MLNMKVLFDLDGTLHDKVTSLHRCGQSLFDEFLADSDIDGVAFVTAFVRENSIIQPQTKVFSKLGETFALSDKIYVDYCLLTFADFPALWARMTGTA